MNDVVELARITVDPDTVTKLKGLSEVLVFCDEQGNVLGRFEPDYKSPAYRQWLRSLDPGISEEEIQRRIERWQGIPTDAVLSRLRGKR